MTEPVRITGFFATFDTEAVLSQLRAVREIAISRLEVDEARAQVRQQLIADISADLASLLGRAKLLTLPNSTLAKTASVSGTAVSAAATPTSTLGSYTVDVTQLATATTVDGSAISAGVDATAALSEGNFGTSPTNGTYTVGTTAGGSATLTIGEAAVANSALLNATNFGTDVTDGTFTLATVGGGSQAFTIDIATDSLDDVITDINGSSIGITATITNDANGRANIITLTSTQGDITVGDAADTSNFLSATNLEAAIGTTTIASTAAFTKQMTLNEVITDINGAGLGITATVQNDGSGRPNLLQLTAASDISIGNATDTSNFLTATHLLASPGTTTRASTLGIARLNPSESMIDASFFGGAPASGSHHFTINGVQIDYDIATDSLNDVISRINGSSAGVTALYNAADDRLEFAQTATGSLEITLADDGAGGDFLSKMGLLAATQTLGDNAEYSVNGGATQYSASNTVSPLPGSTMTLLETTEVGSPETVTVTQDTATVITAIRNFVDGYNAAVLTIDDATNIDLDDSTNSGELTGDATVRQLKSTMRSLVTGRGLNVGGAYQSMTQIGLTFGEFGSELGSSDTLTLDESAFTDALAADPVSVQALFEAFTLDASLTGGGTGSIDSIAGTYSGNIAGTYTIIDDGAGNLTSVFRDIHGDETTTFATIVASGTETTLVPGMTLNIAATLQAGQHTIVVSNTSISPMRQIQDFLESQAGTGDVLDLRQDSYDAIATDVRERIDILQERIDGEMDRLRVKFIAMEQAQAAASIAFGVLDAMAAQLASLNAQSRR